LANKEVVIPVSLPPPATKTPTITTVLTPIPATNNLVVPVPPPSALSTQSAATLSTLSTSTLGTSAKAPITSVMLLRPNSPTKSNTRPPKKKQALQSQPQQTKDNEEPTPKK